MGILDYILWPFFYVRNAFRVAFRNYYEKRISLPHGVAMFMGNVAFIQLDKGEYVDLAPDAGVGFMKLTTEGMRPMLTFEVFPIGGKNFLYVQIIVEDRGFQLRKESPVSIAARQEVITANSLVKRKEDLKPIPLPVYEEDWNLVEIDDPHVARLKDFFLSFSFYQPLMVGHKRRIEG